MAYKQATINKVFKLKLHDALGKLSQQLSINYIDYSVFSNGIADIHISDSGKNILFFVNDEQSSKPLITAKKNNLLRWEEYCSKEFLQSLEDKRGFKSQGICIIKINDKNRETLSISTNNMDIDFYQLVNNDQSLQETLITTLRNHIAEHPSQPIAITVNISGTSGLTVVNEDLFKTLEADPNQKNLILNEHLKAQTNFIHPKKPLSIDTNIKPIWNLDKLEQVSADLCISIETVQAYIQLLRRKEINLYDGEIDCLYCACLGYTAKETARALDISDHTAREYRKSLIKKLNANSITNAIYIAFKRNILS